MGAREAQGSRRAVNTLTLHADRLLRLSAEERHRLCTALQGLVPSSPLGLEEEEAEEIAGKIGVDVETVGSAVALIDSLDRAGTLGRERVITALEAERPEQDVHGLIKDLEPAIDPLSQKIDRLQEIARAMPMLQRVAVSCDLRQIMGDREDGAPLDLTPVAIVRVTLDEGNDTIFQCSPEGLTRLVKKLENAAKQIEHLTRLAREVAAVNESREGV